MDISYPIVDEDDKLLYNLVCTKEALHKSGKPHRSVHIFIETYKGGFVLQRKSANSENGGKLSSAVSGHVHGGETYAVAAIREMEEEIGIKTDEGELTELAKCKPCKETANEFVVLFSYLMDPDKEILKPNPDELDELIVLPRTEVEKDVQASPEKYSPAFRLLLVYLYGGPDEYVRRTFG